jgi:hypothetical protein
MGRFAQGGKHTNGTRQQVQSQPRQAFFSRPANVLRNFSTLGPTTTAQ